MNISIKATELDLTPSIRIYLDQKLETLRSLLSRYEEQGETTLFVEIARTTHHHRHGQVYAAQLTVQIPKKLVRAEETHEDIRVAIDKARDTMKKELARIKGKEVTLRKKKR